MQQMGAAKDICNQNILIIITILRVGLKGSELIHNN